MSSIKQFLTTFLAVSFTAWNFIFIGVVYCLILPFIGIPLIIAVFNGEIEPEFSLAFLGLIVTPPFCTYVGYKYFYHQPPKLARLLYGVEAPLFLLYLIRPISKKSVIFIGQKIHNVCGMAKKLKGLQNG